MGAPLDITGDRYHRLEVMYRTDRVGKNGQRYWHCKCDCGNEVTVLAGSLRRGHTKSCGCLIIDMMTGKSPANKTHGLSKSNEYRIWGYMIHRCHNKNNQAYNHYGGRGISVCDEWRNNFLSFYEDMGKRPSKKHSLERLDNDGNYEPKNVVWCTHIEQGRNKSTTIYKVFKGERRPLSEWAEIIGINYKTLFSRLYQYGWDVDRAFSTDPTLYHKGLKDEKGL